MWRAVWYLEFMGVEEVEVLTARKEKESYIISSDIHICNARELF